MVESLDAQVAALIAKGRIQEGIALVEQASVRGDDTALFRQAVWKLSGYPVPRDLPGARKLLRQAASAGNMDAALMEIPLVGNGSGGIPDWPRAISLLKQIATRSEHAAQQLMLLERLELTDNGMPRKSIDVRQVSSTPRIWHAPNFLTADECLHIANCAVDMLQPAMVIDPETRRPMANPIRTSDGAVIGPTRETLVVQAINKRIALLTGTAVDQGEALSVLRYRAGQHFGPHLDTLDGTNNQRVMTVLLYLNDSFVGGETQFPRTGFIHTPVSGDALLFDNVLSDGSSDPSAIHMGKVVTRGVKWLATRWIRARRFDVWQGPEIAISN